MTLAKMRSDFFGEFFNISIAFNEIGRILGRLPFKGFILTVLRSKSIFVQVKR